MPFELPIVILVSPTSSSSLVGSTIIFFPTL